MEDKPANMVACQIGSFCLTIYTFCSWSLWFSYWRCVAGLLDEVEVILLALWHRKWELLVSFSPFLMVFVSFLAFVHWNGSVVLGIVHVSSFNFEAYEGPLLLVSHCMSWYGRCKRSSHSFTTFCTDHVFWSGFCSCCGSSTLQYRSNCGPVPVILEEKAHQFLSSAHSCYCWLLLCTFLQVREPVSTLSKLP